MTRQFPTTPQNLAPLACIAAISLWLSACVYQVDVQQGNLLEDSDVAAVEVGMTRSQVRFLLGTPAVADSFHQDRWDYVYYFRKGRSKNPERAWMIVFFSNDRVSEIRRDVPLAPG